MLNQDWLIEEKNYNPKKELYSETIYALSNGYMASRGTLEENHFCPEIRSYFGTYVSGIFDTYSSHYQAIVNLADFFNTGVYINGEFLKMSNGKISNYKRYLDMYNSCLMRTFTWTNRKGNKTEVEIRRFVSQADEHIAALEYKIRPINYSGKVVIKNILDGNVSNIDFRNSGYQLRDEKYYLIDEDKYNAVSTKTGGYLTLNTKTTKHSVCEAFSCRVYENGNRMPVRAGSRSSKRYFQSNLKLSVIKSKEYVFHKIIAVYSSKDNAGNVERASLKKLKSAEKKGYEELFLEHKNEWNKLWHIANVEIKGDKRDQRNIRFNIYHLIQMGNKKNPYVNIGSRGLTSEMHYGNSFWDTEIFILPFFTFTDPDSAKALVKYRYLTLDTAREKAKKLWFKGAMYPWMSSYPGHEQADYWEYANIAVHVVSDVAFGLMNYFYATNDTEFMLNYGVEMLIETARFWQSRVTYSKPRKKYVTNLVKGPNEYGIVNNNTYTNFNARWNLIQARKTVEWAKKKYPVKYAKISKKLKFNISELKAWGDIISKMYINYDKKRDLYIEDDQFMEKEPADIKKMKPGKVISTELGYSWDTFLRLQIVKQADVLLLMYLHRSSFTKKQIKNAWDFYEPKTLHDSSLSYNTHSIIANELGLKKKSMEYFQSSARLDLEDVMANVFLGIHAANAGGTWQAVICGYCGMRMDMEKDILEFNPNLPDKWKEVSFKIMFKGNLFAINIKGEKVSISLEEKYSGAGRVKVKEGKIIAL